MPAASCPAATSCRPHPGGELVAAALEISADELFYLGGERLRLGTGRRRRTAYDQQCHHGRAGSHIATLAAQRRAPRPSVILNTSPAAVSISTAPGTSFHAQSMQAYMPVLVSRPQVLLTPRVRCARRARREEGAYREYATDEQRRAPGCSAANVTGLRGRDTRRTRLLTQMRRAPGNNYRLAGLIARVAASARRSSNADRMSVTAV